MQHYEIVTKEYRREGDYPIDLPKKAQQGYEVVDAGWGRSAKGAMQRLRDMEAFTSLRRYIVTYRRPMSERRTW
jgi:hypothetical protein